MINISKALFPVHFPFKLEETVVRDFKLLSSAFVGDLLDIFLKSSNAKQNFQHGPIKIDELGVEGYDTRVQFRRIFASNQVNKQSISRKNS